jgi:hypothetical protein
MQILEVEDFCLYNGCYSSQFIVFLVNSGKRYIIFTTISISETKGTSLIEFKTARFNFYAIQCVDIRSGISLFYLPLAHYFFPSVLFAPSVPMPANQFPVFHGKNNLSISLCNISNYPAAVEFWRGIMETNATFSFRISICVSHIKDNFFLSLNIYRSI